VPTVATIALLFVASALLLLAGTAIGRSRGRAPGRAIAGVMAAMTGLGTGFLALVMPVVPLIAFPVSVAAILVVAWVLRRDWHLIGWFLIGVGGFWALSQALVVANDLSDPAVTIPGWSPVPFALGISATILGLTVIFAERFQRSS
jgi:Ca2+/Na+ antiporter